MNSEPFKPVWFVGETKRELNAHYRRVLPIIREVARNHGYAIGLHGSMKRDLDLMAFPWTEKHCKHTTLLKAIQKACCGFSEKIDRRKCIKPCGRRAYLIHIGMKAHLDISIAPSVTLAE